MGPPDGPTFSVRLMARGVRLPDMKLNPVLLTSVVAVGLSAPLLAAAQSAPPGWQSRRTSDGREIFTPSRTVDGEDTAVIYYPRTSLGDRGLEGYLAAFMTRDVPPRGGKWQGEPAVSGEGNVAHANRRYRDASGSSGHAIYMAISIDQANVRLARWTMSSEAVGQRHAQAGQALLVQLGKLEKAGARSEHRTPPVEEGPADVRGLRLGGPIVPGKYESDPSRTNIGRIVLLVHGNGEFEYLKGNNSSSVGATGTYRYQPGSGKLDVNANLSNNKYDEKDFCVFGRDAGGRPVIYAEQDYSLRVRKAWLSRVGDVDRLPPTEAEAKKKAERAEADRYKFVTAPGKGVRLSQIEAIYYAWEQAVRYDGMHFDEAIFLLLKDGTVRDGLPVAPSELDVALSKRLEPKMWGRWRRKGSDYAFSWNGGSHPYAGNGRSLRPARKGQRLAGEWGSTSGSHVEGIRTSVRRWGITLGRDGRFETTRSGSSYVGEGGTEPMVSTVYDDEGSATSATTPTFSGTGTRKRADLGDRTGTYELDGYTLTLRYDDGRVVRQAFALDAGAKGTSIWFEGSLMDPKR